MTTQTIHQYRHKKFDQYKRPRESDFDPSEDNSISDSLSIRWVSVPSSFKPGQENKSLSTPEAVPQNALSSSRKLSNTSPESNRPKRRQLEFEYKTNEFQIKQEIIETGENLLRKLNQNQVRIENENIAEDYVRGDMVRKFLMTEDNLNAQERDEKIGFTCRSIHRIKKNKQVAAEEEYKHFKDTYSQLTDYDDMSAEAYFKKLLKKTEKAMSEIVIID